MGDGATIAVALSSNFSTLFDRCPPFLAKFVSWILLAQCLVAWPALAQFRVEVSGVGLTQIPIAIRIIKSNDHRVCKLLKGCLI